jgi:hypothetical protein
MSGKAILLAAAMGASQPIPAVAPAVAPSTALSFTKPNIDFDCKVLGRDQVMRTVRFHLAGSRGYPTVGVPTVAATEATFKIVMDETGFFEVSDALYDNTAFEKFSGDWNGPLGRFDKSGRVYSAVRFFPNWDNSAAIVIERQTPPMGSGAPNFAFAGICHLAKTQQYPMKAAPVMKDGGQ